ncbi:MAG: Coq4 family protein [Myxococcota bacterium]
MNRWALLREIRTAMNEPHRIGDVAAYKGELGKARARPEVEAQLDAVRGYHPPIDLAALAQLPAGSFGHEYARFMTTHRLHPIVPTAAVDAAIVARNAFTVRYAAIHDMVHVLTGFDTTWPGEAGVWAFVGGQNYSLGFRIAAVFSLLVAPFRSPLRILTAWRNWRRGWAMGRTATTVLPLRLEERFEQPLADVRAALGIEGATAGYLPA